MQLALDEHDQPRAAAYSSHNSGSRCPWSDVQLDQGGRPVVYVAQDSHANFFRPRFFEGEDNADGLGAQDLPAEVLNAADADIARALAWPGRWGGSRPVDVIGPLDPEGSPFGPAVRTGEAALKWTDPGAWAANLSDACEPGESASASRTKRSVGSLGRPMSIRARRRGASVVVRARFRRPLSRSLRVTLVSTNSLPAVSRTIRVHQRRKSTVRLRRGLGEPVRVRVSSFDLKSRRIRAVKTTRIE